MFYSNNEKSHSWNGTQLTTLDIHIVHVLSLTPLDTIGILFSYGRKWLANTNAPPLPVHSVEKNKKVQETSKQGKMHLESRGKLTPSPGPPIGEELDKRARFR